ncbi:MAG: hypothetical protein KatS3mg115_0608 [Candidatus Poribacteria bacterium]|nr:MAG: hypothetical protein KatS3mg115_0608 [Candidatus Poribacteria bacterium]
MIQALRNAWRMPELRQKILFTAWILVVYRLGSHILVPGIDAEALSELWEQLSGALGALKVVDVFSGANFSQMTIFALGIQPYISASIILQLLTVVVPQLEQLAKEGPTGRRKINQYTRYGTIGLTAFQSIAISAALMNPQTFGFDRPIVVHGGIGFYFTTMLTLTAGTTFVMWLGEQIEERGIGQGISLIIYVGIVAGLPSGVLEVIRYLTNPDVGGFGLIGVVAIVAATIVIIIGTIFITLAERRIPIQYLPTTGRTPGLRRSDPIPAVEGELRRRDADHLCDHDHAVPNGVHQPAAGIWSPAGDGDAVQSRASVLLRLRAADHLLHVLLYGGYH